MHWKLEFLGQMLYGMLGAKDTLIIVDPSDIQKDCAEKMECLARVRDGSKGQAGGAA